MKKVIFILCFFALFNLNGQPILTVEETIVAFANPNDGINAYITAISGFAERNSGTMMVGYKDLTRLAKIENNLWTESAIPMGLWGGDLEFVTENLLYNKDADVTWVLQRSVFGYVRLIKMSHGDDDDSDFIDYGFIGFVENEMAGQNPMAMDSTGKLWLSTNEYLRSIEEINNELTVIDHYFDTILPIPLVIPHDIEVAADGSIWYAIYHYILRFDGNQHEIMYEGPGSFLKKIAIGENGEVFAIEASSLTNDFNNKVYRFTPEEPNGEELEITCSENPWYATYDIMLGKHGELWVTGREDIISTGMARVKLAVYYENEWICVEEADNPFRWHYSFIGDIPNLYKGKNNNVMLPYGGIQNQSNFVNPLLLYNISLDGLVDVEAEPTQNRLTLAISPNPATLFINIDYTLSKKTAVQIDIFDLSGKRVFQQKRADFPVGKHSTQIKTDQLSSGIYIIEMLTNQGKVFEKVVIQ